MARVDTDIPGLRSLCLIAIFTGLAPVFGLGACTDPTVAEGTYQEVTPIVAGDREFAYKLTLFRFGDEVGGVIRFFELNGPLEFQHNTLDFPFAAESHCSLFGPRPVQDNQFVFSIDDGPEGRAYTFRFSVMDENLLGGVISEAPDETVLAAAPYEPVDLSMLQTGQQPDRACERRLANVEVVADLPPLSVAEAPFAGLAVAWVGYDIQNNGQRLIRRVNDDTITVFQQSAERWVSEQRLTLPPRPPDVGFSAPDDPHGTVPYALGYIVLFDDTNGDGVFEHQVAADRVLAVSLEHVLFYMAGPAEDLNRSVANVFTDLREVESGYGVFAVETVLEGQNARIVSASRRATNRIVLTPVEDSRRPPYPLLLPTE